MGGTVIKPNVVPNGSPGRRIVIDATSVNVRAFGATRDGVADDTTAINNRYSIVIYWRRMLHTAWHIHGLLLLELSSELMSIYEAQASTQPP
jgi:hypothetical protein